MCRIYELLTDCVNQKFPQQQRQESLHSGFTVSVKGGSAVSIRASQKHRLHEAPAPGVITCFISGTSGCITKKQTSKGGFQKLKEQIMKISLVSVNGTEMKGS